MPLNCGHDISHLGEFAGKPFCRLCAEQSHSKLNEILKESKVSAIYSKPAIGIEEYREAQKRIEELTAEVLRLTLENEMEKRRLDTLQRWQEENPDSFYGFTYEEAIECMNDDGEMQMDYRPIIDVRGSLDALADAMKGRKQGDFGGGET